MIKILFFDYRELETVNGFTRRLEQPKKEASAPLFVADQPWENGNMQLYGSVAKAPDRPFQMWYSVIHRPWNMYLAYAESDDGIHWQQPALDIFEFEGQTTNIVLTADPHGPAVMYDELEPDPGRRYKMLAGANPSGLITAFGSADGVHWQQMGRCPVITTDPDCPMGLFRARDGRYVAFHRVKGYGRRVFRSESWDFMHWSAEPRMVLEPDASDECQIQYYGFGSTTYGDYEIGTLWMYHTETDEVGYGKMRGYQEAELTYARSGYAVHRASSGQPFIPHGAPGEWDQGNLQCASQPVFLDDEIRYYYMGTDMRHQTHWELEPQTAGLGVARMKPDRFVALEAGDETAELLTVTFGLASPRVFVNSTTGKDGWVRVNVLDAEARPLSGSEGAASDAIVGDCTAHEVPWPDSVDAQTAVGKPVRLRVQARNARVYSLFNTEPGETPVYHRFRSARP